MTFTPKTWGNLPAGGTKLNNVALIDMETRLAAYTDTQVSAVEIVADAPNGVDDTIGLNNVAVAAVARGGATVALRSGDYLTPSGVDGQSLVRFHGAGKGGATTWRKTGNCDLLRHVGASNTVRNQRGGMQDVKLDGSGFSGALIKMKWADHLNFDRVWGWNNNGYGMYFENVWDTTMFDVEMEGVSGSDGFHPTYFVTSNSDDSSNILTFIACRAEDFKDGAFWVSSGPMVSAYNLATGPNPPYGIRWLGASKWETPQLRGMVYALSADVSDVHLSDMYIAARGLYAGSTAGLTMFDVIGAYDLTFERLKILINGVTYSTISDVFRIYTNANGLVFRDIMIDCQQLPSGAIRNIAGGSPDFVWENVNVRSGQTPTWSAGTWPPVVASAATITLPRNPPLVTITGTTNIATITPQLDRRVTLRFTGVLTVSDGSGNLRLAGNLTTAADTTLDLIGDGTLWYEIGRSAN